MVPMTDPDCIFCKIVAGEIPSEKTYEDEHTVAFLDIAPKTPGHTLLIPKNHHEWFYEMPDETYSHVFGVVKKLTPELLKENNAEIMKVAIVGTEVPHVHVHLMPFTLANAPAL